MVQQRAKPLQGRQVVAHVVVGDHHAFVARRMHARRHTGHLAVQEHRGRVDAQVQHAGAINAGRMRSIEPD